MSKENSLWGAPRIHGELLKDCIIATRGYDFREGQGWPKHHGRVRHLYEVLMPAGVWVI
jgi:hypothetical protein